MYKVWNGNKDYEIGKKYKIISKEKYASLPEKIECIDTFGEVKKVKKDFGMGDVIKENFGKTLTASRNGNFYNVVGIVAKEDEYGCTWAPWFLEINWDLQMEFDFETL